MKSIKNHEIVLDVHYRSSAINDSIIISSDKHIHLLSICLYKAWQGMQKKIYNPSPPSLGGYNLKSKLNNSYKKRYRFKAVKVKGMW